MEFKEITDYEFNQFAKKYTLSSIYQTVEYGKVMQNQKFQPFFVGMIDDTNTIIAASLIIIEKLNKFKYAYAPRGFLIDYMDFELLKEFTAGVKKFLNKQNVMAIKICPLITKAKYTPTTKVVIANPDYGIIMDNLKKLKYYHLGFNNFFEALKPRFVAITNLNPDTNKMFENLHQDFKAKIKTCDLAGVRIYKGDETNIELIVEQMREKNATSKDYATDMYHSFNSSNCAEIYYANLETKTFLINTQIEYQKQASVCHDITEEIFKNQGKANNELIAKKITSDNLLANLKKQLVYATNLLRDYPNGVVVATAMVIKNRSQVYLTLDGYNNEFKHLYAKHLLIWKLMERFAKEGYLEFNLGGIANPLINENNKYKGLTDFKLNFNGSSIEYIGDFELVTSYPLYTLYRNTSPIRRILKK